MTMQASKVGTIDGWYVGDTAFSWMLKLREHGVDRTFDGWKDVEIVSLYDSGVAVVKVDLSAHPMYAGKDPQRMHISTNHLKKRHEIRSSKNEKFPVGSGIVLLTHTPRAGLLGSVITPDEARKGGYRGSTDEFVMAVLHDSAMVGGWFPESLGIAGDLSPAQWPTPKKGPEPKNNDGRQNCYWCGAPTREIELAFSSGRVCTACGR